MRLPVSKVTYIFGFLLFITAVLTACAGQGASVEPEETPIVEPVTVTPIEVAQPSPIPTIDDSNRLPQELVVWWPDTLRPGDDAQLGDVLESQIRAFDATHDINLEFRLKRYGDVGGIMSTLRAASGIAPGALPDVTLLRRADLLAAFEAGLIYPVDAQISESTLNGLYIPALTLGQIEDRLFGLPYMVDVLMVVHEGGGSISSENDGANDNFWSFEDILNEDINWVFPGRRVNGINNTLLIQYIDAGGTIPLTEDVMRLNQGALETVLSFYEMAVSEGLVDPQVLDFTTPVDYQSDLFDEANDAAVVTSTHFLSEYTSDLMLGAASIPTDSGRPASIINGWIWVITTDNVERQVLAAEFINWMMDVERQVQFAEAVSMLPSQRVALQQYTIDSDILSLMDALIEGAMPPLADSFDNIVARIIQSAFASVVSGERTAEEAVQQAVDQLTRG